MIPMEDGEQVKSNLDLSKNKGFLKRFFSYIRKDVQKDLNNRELAVAVHGKESYYKSEPNQHISLQWIVKN